MAITANDELDKLEKGALEQADAWSFEIKDLRKHLKPDNDADRILKANLYIEHILIGSLEASFMHNDVMSLYDLGFKTKLNLCISLGIISKDMNAPIRLLNDFRNNISHILDFEFDNKKQRKFWYSIPKDIRHELCNHENVKKSEWNSIPMDKIFATFVLCLDLNRKAYIMSKIKRQFSERRLQLALDALEPGDLD